MDIIGLYSDVAENPGFISGSIPGSHQQAWLITTLTLIATQPKAGSHNV